MSPIRTGEHGRRGRTVFALSSLAITLVGLGVAAGCTSDGQTPAPSVMPSLTSSSSASQAATPSVSRDVAPDQRRAMTTMSAADLCGTVSPDDLAKLAYPVQPGQPSETQPARGCTFSADGGTRSILVAAQPDGYGQVGEEEIAFGDVHGTQTAHANDCTVYVPVLGATLQITATAAEADSNQCEQAQSVAQYVLPGLVH